MRYLHDRQMPLEFQPFDPKSGAILKKIEEVLKDKDDILRFVLKDITGGKSKFKGRDGMSAEQVLRVAITKQLYDWDYRTLRDRIEDSSILRSFCRYDFIPVPEFQTMQRNVKRLSPETWEEINKALVLHAKVICIESGKNARTDTTVVETNIHHPTDSSLIWDSVRVITRILEFSRKEFPEAGIVFNDRRRVVKKRMKAILDAKNEEQRKFLYTDMVKYGEEVLGFGRNGAEKLDKFIRNGSVTFNEAMLAKAISDDLKKYCSFLERILDQTRRRVFKGENVPPHEKIVSIFEDHTDIIVKKKRETEFGHKVCLTVGKSSLVLDCVIERGNPSDTSLFPKALDRHIDLFGEAPISMAADGGFASLENAKIAKEKGIKNVFFNKQAGKEAEKLFPNERIRRKLRRFRAGIEGVISALKRAVGMGRCLWKGWKSFQSYVRASIVAHNLKIMAKLLIARDGKPAAAVG